MTPIVSIIMGSTSDLPVMEKAAQLLNDMHVPFEMNALSAHRTPEAVEEFAPKLVMNMYPTYGFFMPNGDILGTVSPFLLAKNPELFLERGKKAWEQAEVKRNNKRSIVFEEIGLKEALEKAKKENKLVFIDAYTAWCQPCVMMGKNVFTLDKVADFYNRNFINLKIDFGKESIAETREIPYNNAV